MKLVSALTLLAAIAATAVRASPKQDVTTSPAATMGTTCDVTGYKVTSSVLAPAFDIPDNLGGDSLVTTLTVPDDSTEFLDVIATVKLAHTFVGDLVLRLEYFGNCSSPTPVASVDLICRPRGTDTASPAPCGPDPASNNGGGSNLGTSATNSANTPDLYSFADDAVTRIADGTNPPLIPAGCYLPSSGTLSAFSGLRKGGCFRLFAADYAPLDVGSIEELHVYSMNSQNVPAERVSWGSLKTMYH